ncbi:phage tail protein [Acinetobacter nematophilus]|uniref:Phage tail protein n=1 Tax=Acinetobacter nematophilus TaxID=2994642 RepID=A0A9X3IGG4_9GAMM|nr:phage tail protein [Acinetobacter nematophilus]MCX5466239.1 phage tail protein [Acinetobacter nematophilus]
MLVYGSFVTMMRLGDFKFGIYTAAYQELNRTTQYQWGEQSVLGDWDNLQFLGPGQDTMTLTGVIFPEWNGGTRQLDNLRGLGSLGKPQLLINGSGKVLGNWIITEVSEGQSKHAAFGVPRRQEFMINLRKHSDVMGSLGLANIIRGAIGRL